MADLSKGDKVEWDWGNGTATGKVKKITPEKITRTLKGSEITRNGSDGDPALLIEQADGDEVLKLMSEVRRA